MNIHFTARQMKLTPEIKDYCEKRLRQLTRLLGPVVEVDIILSTEKKRSKAEINVKARGGSLVVVEETLDLFDSLNRAFDNLEKKIKKEREKFRERKRRKGREKKAFAPAFESGEGEKRVIRSQDYSPKPMPLEEALLQIDIKKKDILVFRKAVSEKLAVLYRRKDGHYGLIEPE
jgi:putative sigma-54 modulation protein